MLVLRAALGRTDVGGKARSLARLHSAGFDVPDAVVLPGAALAEAWPQLSEVSQALAAEPPDLARAWSALDSLAPPPGLTDELSHWLQPGSHYAVRSSSEHEDGAALSGAGVLESYLNVPTDEVAARVVDCFRSCLAPGALAYLLDHGLPWRPDSTAVIVQEMVHPDLAGVAFTVNPVTGADTEIVIEATSGLADELVAGRAEARTTVVDWYAGEVRHDAGLLSPAEQDLLVDTLLRVQLHHGYPCDVEWAIAGGRLWLLQARPVTQIHWAGADAQWTTANFKDGGVAAGVCTPLMWSLYGDVWQRWLPRFLVESHLITPAQGSADAGRLLFARPYWNLSMVKTAMAKAPGYVEREFESELGVRIAYEGPGTTTRLSPRSLLGITRAALTQRRLLRQMERDVAQISARCRATADEHLAALGEPVPGSPAPGTPAGPGAALTDAELEARWRRLVTEDLDQSQGWYFWQIFLNTIHLQLAREAITAVVGPDGYMDLIAGLDDLSHLRPFHDAWTLAQQLRHDPYWLTTPEPQVLADLRCGCPGHGLDQVRDLIARHGHHSAKELDISHPDFSEDPAPLVAVLKQALELDDRYGPGADRDRTQARLAAALERARQRLSPRAYRRFARRVDRTRRLLWWREEMRDTSTRVLHAVRVATLELARRLTARGVLDDPGDIWFATRDDLLEHLTGGLGADTLRERVRRGRTYYSSFREFHPDDELGLLSPSAGGPAPTSGGATVTGTGASTGVVTGTARTVTGLDQVGRLQAGEILVTRFTDPGWAGRFASLGGLVTETGGVLCHAAVVAREYAIPCVVAAAGALRLIPDGARVQVDGGTGQVIVLSDGEEPTAGPEQEVGHA